MASEYLKWKYRDVQPDEPIRLNRKEKIRNWWYYHKWHVALGAVLLVIAADILGSALGIGVTQPDYQLAYIGSVELPEKTAAVLENAVAAYGTDCNGDGKVTVKLNQYLVSVSSAVQTPQNAVSAQNTQQADDATYAYGNQITLMADLEACESCIFILDDCETFQSNYQVLADADGVLTSGEAYAVRWEDCPALAAIDFGEDDAISLTKAVAAEPLSAKALLSDMQVARRGWYQDRECKYRPECDALWDKLTEAVQ